MAAIATCITCATVYRDRNEDGEPEIPGQRCADPDCELWICSGECSEHFSFVCECGDRFCNEHRITLYGMSLCRPCAVRQWNTCQACGAAAVEHRLIDQSGLCGNCFREIDRDTRHFPDCPGCKHRFWVSDMDERHHVSATGRDVVMRPGRMYRCSCGLKFTREAALAEAPAMPLFAPRLALFLPPQR